VHNQKARKLRRRKNALVRPVIFPGRAGRPPFRGTEVWGTKGEGTASPSLHRRSDAQRMPPKKAARMGDEGKAASCVPLAALLSALPSAAMNSRRRIT
jgi:hypothetical protein